MTSESSKAKKGARRNPQVFARSKVSFDDWKTAFLKDPDTIQALARLLSTQPSRSAIGRLARCETILMYIYGYTAGETPQWLDDLKVQGQALHRKIGRVSEHLKELSDKTGKLEDWETWFLKIPQDAMNASEEIGRELGVVARRGLKHLSERNINRDFLLLLLVHSIKLAAGQPYYDEVSKLLYTSALVLKTELHPSGEAIRALYTRFIKRNPNMLDACLAGRLP